MHTCVRVHACLYVWACSFFSHYDTYALSYTRACMHKNSMMHIPIQLSVALTQQNGRASSALLLLSIMKTQRRRLCWKALRNEAELGQAWARNCFTHLFPTILRAQTIEYTMLQMVVPHAYFVCSCLFASSFILNFSTCCFKLWTFPITFLHTSAPHGWRTTSSRRLHRHR